MGGVEIVMLTRRSMMGYSAASLALLAGCAARVTQTLPAEEGAAAPAGSPMQALMDRLAREYLRAAPEWSTVLAVPEERAPPIECAQGVTTLRERRAPRSRNRPLMRSTSDVTLAIDP